MDRAEELKAGQTLSSGEIYDIVDETYGETKLSDDLRLRNRIKSQRNRVSGRVKGRGGEKNQTKDRYENEGQPNKEQGAIAPAGAELE